MLLKIPKELKFLDSILKSMIHKHDYSINLSELQKIQIDTPYAKAWNKIKSIKGIFEIEYNTFSQDFLGYSLHYLVQNKLIYITKKDIYTLTIDGIIKIRRGGFSGEMRNND